MIKILAASVFWTMYMYTSYVDLELTDNAACPLLLTFQNEDIHVEGETEFELELDGYVVGVFIDVNADEDVNEVLGIWPDRLYVTPPEGMIAVPDQILVQEGEKDSVEICHAMF